MKIARGKIKELLLVIGKIQDLNGSAQSAWYNDRAVDRAAKIQPLFKEIHELCISACGEYYIVEEGR